MAFSDADLEKLAEVLEKVNARFGGLETAISLAEQNAKSTSKSFTQDAVTYKRLLEERKKEEREIIKAQREGKISYREAKAEIIKLNQKIEDVIPPGYEQAFKGYMAVTNARTEVEMRGARTTEYFLKGIEGARKAIEPFSNLGYKTLQSYSTGATDIEMAASITQSSMDFLAASGSNLGQGLQKVGGAAQLAAPALTALGPYGAIAAGALEVLGLAATAVGGTLDFLSKEFKELVDKALPIVNAEFTKLYNNFNALNASGAMFTNGMQGMVDAALAANLTLPEFADVVKSNTANLASLGLGVTEAAKRIGDVGTVMRTNKTAYELQKLGYTFKEQAALVADTMALMRQTGQSLQGVDATEIAETTRKYAENLRLVSALTGEDAKKREAEAQQAASELAFQQKLDGMDEKARVNVIAALENMSAPMKKAFMEMVVFGQTVTRGSAYAQANLPGFGNALNQATQSFLDGTLDGQKQAQINADNQEALRGDLNSSVDLARAGMLGVSDAAKEFKDILQAEVAFRKGYSQDAVSAAKAEIEFGKRVTGITEDILEVANAGRKASQIIQEKILDSNVLQGFALVTAGVTLSVSKTIDGFVDKFKIPDDVIKGIQKTFPELLQAGELGAHALEQVSPLSHTSATIGYNPLSPYGVGSGAGTPNMVRASDTMTTDGTRAYTFGIGNTMTTDGTRAYTFGIGQADGGIVSGPRNGYLAKLHGTEAVLPENLTNMLLETARQNQTLSENLPQAINRPNKSEELLSMLNSKFDDMLDVMSDISNYTERTSVRVA